jgi:hypothetical protein
MKIYPNPSKSTAYLSIPGELSSGYNLTITNTKGERVLEQVFGELSNVVIPLDLTNQPSGFYKVTLGNEVEEMSNDLLLLSEN